MYGTLFLKEDKIIEDVCVRHRSEKTFVGLDVLFVRIDGFN